MKPTIKNKQVYFSSYSGAVQMAKSETCLKGFYPNDEDWFQSITTGPGKPTIGETVRHTIIIDDSKKCLQIQVYNRGGNNEPYELNHYVM